MRTFHLALVGVITVLVHGSNSTAQVPAQPSSFDAASIKQNKSGGNGSFIGRRPGGLSAQNAGLRELIQFAYRIQTFQLVGGPSWVDTDRWDIVAKLESSSQTPQGNSDETMLALRTLLAERFKLAVRRETRQLPIYALVLARSNGRLGTQMSESTTDCPALMAARQRGGPPPAKPCGLRGRVGSIQSAGVPLSEFVIALSDRVQRTVVDRTGLKGTWDFTLTYTPEPSQIPQGAVAPGAPVPAFDPNGPSLFTALEEQLGLKLESTRGPVEVLVIDRVERPRDN